MPPTGQGALDDTHEFYDPSTLTNPSRQRQQQPAFEPSFSYSAQHPPRPASASGHHRPIRRISPQGGLNQPSSTAHRRVASIDAALLPPRNRNNNPLASNPEFGRRATGVPSAEIAPALSEAETEAGTSIAGDSITQTDESYWPPRSTRISPRTASAIRWALEEAIRKPFPFTPVLEELNAPMSDLMGPSGPVGTGAQTRPQNGGSRPVQGPRQAHSQVPAGMRTPTDIMRDRRDREARKRAEKEAREREQQEQELELEQTKQQIQGQQYAAAGATSGEFPVQRRQPNVRQPAGVDSTTYPEQPLASFQQSPAATTRRPANTQRTAISQGQPRPAPVAASQQQATAAAPAGTTFQKSQSQSQPQPRQAMPTQIAVQPGTSSSQPPPDPSQSQPPQTQDQQRRTTFPHAFERWETLSSHWEGLTGYWIRKLEQNNNELSQDPLNQQMARQINDLSAAGANLFHAVVELQRLRASSERRFQRWFFDTRSEQEKAREAQAELERQVSALRLERDNAVELQQKADADQKRAEDLVKEMRRELQISKEEARRAWEELGRREQEERERTASLRNGEPTVVGGVQVLPMIAGMPSRQNSSANRPPTRDGPYAGGPVTAGMSGQHEEPAEHDSYHDEQSTLSETDPFVEGSRAGQEYQTSARPTTSSGTIVGTTPTSQPPIRPGAYGNPPDQFYRHVGSALHDEPDPDTRSYVASTEGSELEEEYAMNPDGSHRHPQGHHMYAGSEEYDDEDEPYDTAYPPGTSAPPHGYGQGSVDYSGSGWGGWDSITPRHRHPTRLSDVLEEEDERSRTSPSRASQASRGFH